MKTLFNFSPVGKSIMLFALIAFPACHDDQFNEGDGSGAEVTPISKMNKPLPNPYLARENYSITHFNSAQTDAIPYAVKDGEWHIDPSKCEGGWSGPINLMTLSAAVDGYMWGMSSDRVSYYDCRQGGFKKLGEASLPGGMQRTEEQLRTITAPFATLEELGKSISAMLGSFPAYTLSSGNYVLCDKDNFAYSNIGTSLARYRLKDAGNPEAGIELAGSIDIKEYVEGVNALVGVVMTYDGYLAVCYTAGLAIVDRELTQVVATYSLPDDQTLSNSIAVDENGGIYVASSPKVEYADGLMQKLIWRNNKLSDNVADGAWQSPYDGGSIAPSIKMGCGTGSTPTLMGFGSDKDKLVVITDGSNRMKILAFWRDAIPADAREVVPGNPRVAGVRQITCGLSEQTEWIQSEQSVACAGYGAFVVNNIGESGISTNNKVADIIAIGPLIPAPYGAERLEWDVEKQEWKSVWARADVSSPSMIPAISTASELVFVNGYSDKDGWEVTGLDWNTGVTRHRVIFGNTSRGNGTYAILQYFDNGDLLFNSVSGPYRVPLNNK